MNITMKKLLSLLCAMCVLFSASAADKVYTVTSPDGHLSATVTAGSSLSYTVALDGKQLLAPSAIALHLTDGSVLGQGCKVAKRTQKQVSETIAAPFYFRSTIADNYNLLKLDFKGGYSVEFRAYNDGVAYRLATAKKADYTVKSECAEFNFAADHKCWVAYANLTGTKRDPYFTSFENIYNHIPLSEVSDTKLAMTPAVVDVDGVKVCIAESDVEHYPGMFIHNTDKSSSLKGHFAPAAKDIKLGGHNKLQDLVAARHDYLAVCSGTRTFPWRAVIVAKNDAELAQTDMVYRLASPSRVADASWVKPGKVAWEWWNHWGLSGVDFEAGVNTATYKAYIDFAADFGVEYVILDEGWATKYKNDLFDIVPQIDMKHIVDYAASKGVGIILWAGYKAFDVDMERVCQHYSAMGVKGFKIDFLDRDDVDMNDFHYRAAKCCAEYKLMVDFHGCPKPTGLNRTYPNVVNFEAVHGLEQMKWRKENTDQMAYDVTMPYIRMVAGPIDYTQGAMRNAARKNYRPVNNEPMSQGTRCHQLAAYSVFFSPLSMLCDSPTAYRKEAECAAFIASIPTVWEQSVVLDGKIGEWVVTARRAGNTWYVGGMTNWDKRTVELDLSKILGEGTWSVELFRDGANSHRIASDYVRQTLTLDQNKSLTINMAPGGGFMMRISK